MYVRNGVRKDDRAGVPAQIVTISIKGVIVMAVTAVGKSSGFSVKMKVGGDDDNPKLESHSLSGVRYGTEHNDNLYNIGLAIVPIVNGDLYSMERSMTSTLVNG